MGTAKALECLVALLTGLVNARRSHPLNTPGSELLPTGHLPLTEEQVLYVARGVLSLLNLQGVASRRVRA